MESEADPKITYLTDVSPVSEKPKIVTLKSPPVYVKEYEIESEDVPKIRDLTDG